MLIVLRHLFGLLMDLIRLALLAAGAIVALGGIALGLLATVYFFYIAFLQ